MKKRLHRLAGRELALLLGLLAGATAQAGDLQARVVSSAGEPKPFVRVEVSGPARQTLFTDRDGRLSAMGLPGGSYLVQVSEGYRRMDFRIQVPQRGEVNRTFELKW
ncbi:MAG TPA: carboxypeptidase-like regulatory domain-containing protein [Myxococcaceae bacterium]|nr:carboxypeptidase-like regulatory domain-containing protein [Myxococcaceae bacterium]